MSSADPPALPDEAWLLALAELPGMGPSRLDSLLGQHRPQQAWDCIRSGAVPVSVRASAELRSTWQRAARQFDVFARWSHYRRAAVGVIGPSSSAYPRALIADANRPAVLFTCGHPDLLERPCVAIVGTRRCTRYGREVARDLGAHLAAAGVVVVSGLAAGIDAEAHRGALSVDGVPPAGVVGSGLDVVYPRGNRDLWTAVGDRGVLLGEAPLGARPERWRFPARNRIIAGLCAAVIVVESHRTGGSLLTANEAIDRARPVIAVPGPIRSPASHGTNSLVADGAHVLADLDDLRVVLSLAGIDLAPAEVPERQQQSPCSDAAYVLDTIGWQPISFDQLAGLVTLSVSALAVVVEELLGSGQLAQRGPWLERCVASGSEPRP